jgi:hypothetical protein
MLDRVESWLEGLFELPARRLFRTRLQPVELARAVVHAMEQQRLIGPKGELVPNHYLVALHPADYDQLATWRISLEGELAAHAEQRARERGWRWSGRVVIEIVSDDALRPGRPMAQASYRDTLPPAGGPVAEAATLEETAVLARPVVPHPRAGVDASAYLQTEDGRTVPLTTALVRVGRAGDNEVVLDHPSVSRYHACLHADGDGYRLVDLDSHNGTRVNGAPITEQRLANGDRIEAGAVALRYQGRR